MIAKIHICNGKKIIALCDNNLIGKKFEENNLQLDLTSDFYNGKKINSKELRKEISNAYLLNIVGQDCINFCLDNNLISKNRIIKIKSIPHAQVIFTED